MGHIAIVGHDGRVDGVLGSRKQTLKYMVNRCNRYTWKNTIIVCAVVRPRFLAK